MKKKKKRVLVKRYGEKSTLYFRNWVYKPPRKTCADALNAAILANRCSYGDVSQVVHGEISLNFNPLRHKRRERRRLENEFKELIKQYP
ncbi:hypothetical protein IKG13_01775 [Candidatus Saccharibacteria bacterium]|nr:hypothetical protein [Candidatus Saccharibacteria bacterium]MBR3378473.1 hypothetical protein [Candidatus Saccharibacteria bacterium]